MESLALKYTFDDEEDSRMSKMFDGVMPRHKHAPASNATFFIDSDLDETESEAGDSYDEPSPVDSVESSATTISPATPKTALPPTPSRNLVFRLKSVKGRPSQDDGHAHLFRASLASTQDFNWPSYDPNDPSVEPVPDIPAPLRAAPPLPPPPPPPPAAAATAHQQQQQHPLPALPSSAAATTTSDEPRRDSADDADTDVGQWTTQQVAAWMFNSGFESAIISSFLTHDINGAILLDLRFDDLRELDILSFGKRVQIWNEVTALRLEGTAPDPLTSASGARVDRACSTQSDMDARKSPRKKSSATQRSSGERTTSRSNSSASLAPRHVSPPSSTATDQDVPKPHRCSKGTKCPKWKRQQELINEVDRQHGPPTPPSTQFDKPFDFAPRTPLVVDAMLDNSSEDRGRASNKIVASSDDEEFLRQLQHPQSPTRVKQYLQLQHIVHQVHEVPLSPPSQQHPMLQQLEVGSPVSPLTPATMIENALSASQPSHPHDTQQPRQIPPTPSSSNPLPESFPPRFSSLNTLPKLEIPPSSRPKTPSKHTPSSSDSTIHPLRRDESPGASDAHSRSSSVPPSRGFSPASTGLRPSLTRTATSKPTQTPTTSSPVRRPTGQRLRSPASESDLTMTPGALLSNAEAVANAPPVPPTPSTRGLRPALRSSASDANLAKKRNVAPLPTLKERSRKVSYDKSLPPTPAKSVSSTESVVPPLPKFMPTGVATAKVEKHKQNEKDKTEKISASNSSAGLPQLPRSKTPSPTPTQQPPTPSHAPTRPFFERKLSSGTASERKGSILNPSSDERKPSIIVPPTPGQGANIVYPLSAYGPEVIRIGWARRRRSKLWRHEWSSVHLRLTSTTLSVHATSRPEDSQPLEVIDMDEYTIACSTGSGSGKLAAAVRSLRLGGSANAARSQSPGASGLDGEHGAAFAWQLVPKAAVNDTPNANIKSVRTEKDRDGEEKTVIVGSRDEAKVLKTHNFAVLTRDERIEWMRQTMLAQALRAKMLSNSKRAAGASTLDLKAEDVIVKSAEIKTRGSRETLEALVVQ